MEFVTHNSQDININGSHLQGYVDAGYDELLTLFGKPHDGDGYKVDAEWSVQFSDGTVATIYNYKNGRNYCGSSGTPKQSITNWHIGGFTKQAVDNVQIAVDLFREQKAPKPETKAEEAFDTAIAMMEMIRKTKGREYADLVEIVMLAKKQSDLLHVVVSTLVEEDIMPAEVANMMGKVNAAMLSKVVHKFCRVAQLSSERLVDEASEWADRLLEYEQKGAKELVEEHKRKHKESDE
ncbi:MAG: hypothetical protein ACK42H_19455 [Planctomycetota bacterium]|jgi:hypothetical protein